MKMEFLAKSIVITGTSRGIGLELVRQIANLSFPPEVLVATCRDPSNASALQQIAKENAFVKILKMDVEKDDEIDAVVKETRSLVGESGLNLLINNAAIYLHSTMGEGTLRKQSREEMQQHFDINATSPIIVTQKFLPLLELAAARDLCSPMGCARASSIIISGRMGSQTTTYQGQNGVNLAYKCSKNAVNMATILMARDLKDVGILVVAIHPGWVRRDMGTTRADLSVQESVGATIKTLGNLGEKELGLVITYKGEEFPF